MKKSVSILGLGYYGAPLGVELLTTGWKVLGSTTKREKLEKLALQGLNPQLFAYPELPSAELLQSDFLVVNIPPFAEQLGWFKQWSWNPDSKIIFISSTSVFLAQAGMVDEQSSLNTGLLAQQELWVRQNFKNFVILRFGGLIGGSRHPGKSLSGKKDLKSPHTPVNLIHVDDAIGITKAILEKPGVKNETFNVVCDEDHSRQEFYQDFCRRAGLPLPEFDQTDQSIGKKVSNEKLKTIYQLKWPTVSGKSL